MAALIILLSGKPSLTTDVVLRTEETISGA